MTPIINVAGFSISILDIVTFVGLFAFFAVVYFVTEKNQDKADKAKLVLERRIRAISKQQDVLLNEAADGGRESTFSRKRSELAAAIESQSGLIDRIVVLKKKAGINDISLETFLVLCLLGGIVLTAIIIQFNFLSVVSGIPVGMAVGAYLAYTLMAMHAERKRTAFLQQFPEAIDMMIRGVKAGLNIGRIMKLVSIEAQEPVASEFTTISQKFDLGVEPEKVLTEAADRVGLEEFRFLVVALILQMENGGMLGDILQNLCDIVRKRLELNLKLKAMSAEARMSAIIISVLPFIFGGIMALVNPSHVQEFFKPGPGKTLLKVVIVLFCVGSFCMVKATKIKV